MTTTETPSPVVATEQAPSDQPTLMRQEIVAAATNSPALAPDSFMLGDRDFKILYLDYDRNVEFTELMEPLLKGLLAVVASKSKVTIPGIDIPATGINLSSLMTFLKKSLPQMAALSCQMSDKTITEKWVRENATDPYQLARIAMQQIEKNQMLNKFLDFFAQTLPALGMFLKK
jgi:hypothetical protein